MRYLLMLLLVQSGAATAQLQRIGLYADFAEAPRVWQFFQACGYNTYELIEGGFGQPEKELDAYYAKVAAEVARAQKDGIYVSVLLLSNMRQRQDAPIADPVQMVFTPVDEGQMKDRLAHLRRAVRALNGADAFSFFAADPGGDPEKKGTPADFVAMTRAVRKIVREEAPKADFFLNTWAVAAWDQFPSPFENDFWEKETKITKDIVSLPDLLGPEMNMVFPLHNYYRSLTLRTYEEAGKTAELWPTPEVVAELRKRGVKHVWGWPYFLIDEIDDGYSGGTYRQAQAETRYLYAVVGQAHRLGLDGLIGNLSSGGFAPEILNVYAFARFCKEPDLKPARVIQDFCEMITDPAVPENAALPQVIAFIENHSSWEAGLPERDRLPPLETGVISTPEEALRALALVKPLEKPRIPLPETADAYLDRLRQRLEVIQKELATHATPQSP